MVTAGLAVRARTGKVFDRFRGGVMFPIYDVRGDAVGFGARLLEGGGSEVPQLPGDPDLSQVATSLRPQLGEVRDRTRRLCRGGGGLHRCDRAAPRQDAGGGRHLWHRPWREHLDLLRRFSERVVLMFDADEAGINASLRGSSAASPGIWICVSPPSLADAILPMWWVRARSRSCGPHSTNPLRCCSFAWSVSSTASISRSLRKRGRAVRAAAEVVARHPDAVTRHEYGVLVSRRTGVDLDVVVRAIDGAVSGAKTVRPTPPRPIRPLDGVEKAERDLLRLLLANDPGVRRHDLTGVFSAMSIAPPTTCLSRCLRPSTPVCRRIWDRCSVMTTARLR